MDAKEQAEIERLWQKIVARIEWDGGVLHRSSFESEVKEWLTVLRRACERTEGPMQGQLDFFPWPWTGREPPSALSYVPTAVRYHTVWGGADGGHDAA